VQFEKFQRSAQIPKPDLVAYSPSKALRNAESRDEKGLGKREPRTPPRMRPEREGFDLNDGLTPRSPQPRKYRFQRPADDLDLA
jgi:hypothetical protein